MLRRDIALLSVALVLGFACAKSLAQEVVDLDGRHSSSKRIDPRVEEHFEKPDAEPMVVIVVLDETPFESVASKRAAVRQRQQRVLTAMGGEDFVVGYRYANFSALTGCVTRSGFLALANHPEVRAIGCDEISSTQLDFTVPFIGADLVHDLGFTGEGITVAVIDSGIDTNHPDLLDDIAVGAWHFLDQGFDQGPGAEDSFGHGTEVAGVITSSGVVAGTGVAPAADILAVQVLDFLGEGHSSDIVAGIDYVVSVRDDYDQLTVLNLSLGQGLFSACPCDDETADTMLFATALQSARDVGIAPIVASGSQSVCGSMLRPACVSAAIPVAQVTTSAPYGQIVGSAQSTCNRLAAPGIVLTSSVGGGIASVSGTSFAAPHVSGVAALMQEKASLVGSTLDPDTVESLLLATGNPPSDTCAVLPQPLTVDALAAVSAVQIEEFSRGDANGDGDLEGISDAVFVLTYLFSAGASPPCADSADFNDDGAIDVGDGIGILQFSFVGGAPPAVPYPGCGFDPTLDVLGCDDHPCP